MGKVRRHALICPRQDLKTRVRAAGNAGDEVPGAPDRGLQVSPFMMFMLFMGMIYVVLTLQQRATRQVRALPYPPCAPAGRLASRPAAYGRASSALVHHLTPQRCALRIDKIRTPKAEAGARAGETMEGRPSTPAPRQPWTERAPSVKLFREEGRDEIRSAA